jgi:xylan 1,4-beta-xylosidase
MRVSLRSGPELVPFRGRNASVTQSRRRPLFLVAIAMVTGLSFDADAQTPATVNIAVDATSTGTPLERVWSFHGYDEVNYSTTSEGQDLLQILGSIDAVPPHIRTHFLLNTGDGKPSLKWGSTNVYTEDAAGNPVYSWTLMDGIMDAVTGAGNLPLVEIAFMPQAMTTAPATVSYQNTGVYTLDGACFYPPKDFNKWAALIEQWAMHANGRYPNVESSWQWELWNEPDIGYWHGTIAQYLTLYDHTESALHQVLPNASLGGPAVSIPSSPFFAQFLQHCATGTNAVSGKTGTRLDMISFHAKGGTAIVNGHVEMNLGNQLVLHRTGFTRVAAVPQFKQTPIVITEADPDGCAACPVSTNPADAYRTSPAYGAYEVAMMKRTLELEAQMGVNVRGLLTWAFDFPGTPYFAGYRALATHGIQLPVLNAFRLLGSLAGNRLPVTSSGALALADILNGSVRAQADVDAMATRNGHSVQVLVWNYHDDLVTVPASPVHLTVQMPSDFGNVAVVTDMRVDDTHGDAYAVWVSQGRPASPTAAQVAAMQQAMLPSAAEPTRDIALTSGNVALDFTLPRFGISLITLSPPGLDAGAPDAGGADSGTDVSGPVEAGSTNGDGSMGGGSAQDASGGVAGAGGSSGAGASSGSVGSPNGGFDGGDARGGGGGQAAAEGGNAGGCSCGVAGEARGSSGPVSMASVAIALVWMRRRRGPRQRGARDLPRWQWRPGGSFRLREPTLP